MENKYNKTLKIVIIVVGILVVVLFIALGISIYKKYYATQDQAQASENADDYLSKRRRTTNDIDGLNVDTESQTSSSSLKRQTYKGFTLAGYIEIPSISLNPAKMPILERYSSAGLEASPCIVFGPGLNIVGNTVVEGHNYRDGTHLSNISNIKSGDAIYVTDLYNGGARIKYEVYNMYETAAEDKEQVQRTETLGKREITLSTCYGDTNDSRTIIMAKEAEEQPTE